MARRRRHLYRGGAEKRELREFQERYGEEHGKEVYGAVVGKTAAEQAREQGGVKIEHVRGHIATSDRGTRFRVRPHEARVTGTFAHSAPHSYGHHSGRCDGACRRGIRPHKHRRGSSRRG